MTDSMKWVAIMVAMGWATLNAGEAVAQVFYGSPLVGDTYRSDAHAASDGYYVAPTWFNGGHQLTGWSNAPEWAVGQPVENRQFPSFWYEPVSRTAPEWMQPIVSGAEFFSIDDPYYHQPSYGLTPMNSRGLLAPEFGSPFYENSETIIPASGFFPVKFSGGHERSPRFSDPVRPAAPRRPTDSPFDR